MCDFSRAVPRRAPCSRDSPLFSSFANLNVGCLAFRMLPADIFCATASTKLAIKRLALDNPAPAFNLLRAFKLLRTGAVETLRASEAHDYRAAKLAATATVRAAEFEVSRSFAK